MSQFIEFDLRVDDFRRVLVLVKNISANAAATHDNSTQSIQCDCFNENECHHHSKKDHRVDASSETCSYCRFIQLLREKHSNVKVKNDADNATSSLLIKYKTIQYSPDALTWSDFQVRFKNKLNLASNVQPYLDKI